MAYKKLAILLGTIIIGLFIFFIAPRAVSAATFMVDDTGDGADSIPGDSSCDDGSGLCTLRSAIQESNALAGDDVINFNIAGVSPHTISPLTPLPIISQTVTIDGCSQPDADCTVIPYVLTIEISGVNAPANPGFDIELVQDVLIKGLVINHFDLAPGIYITNEAHYNSVTTCYIGTDITGKIGVPNLYGIQIHKFALYNQIGGTGLYDGNIISGNTGYGLVISNAGRGSWESAPSHNSAINNYIGTNFDFEDLGNGLGGIYLTLFDQFNVFFVHNNTVGGTTEREANYIMWNDGPGILIDDMSIYNTVTGNFIFNNSGIGIDIDVDGVTSNDNGDTDGGTQDYLNFPNLIEAIYYQSVLYVAGELDTIDSTTIGGDYNIEFFGNSEDSPGGFVGGEKYIFSQDLTVNTTGVPEQFQYNNSMPVYYGYLTSTNTDPLDSTSEFSNSIYIYPAEIGAALDVSSSTITEDHFEIILDAFVENSGELDISNLQVILDLLSMFPSPHIFEILGVSSSDFSVNSTFNGNIDKNLLTGSDNLAIAESGHILINLRIHPSDGDMSFTGSILATGVAHGNVLSVEVSDISTDGSETDANGNGDPSDDSTLTRFQYTEPELPDTSTTLFLKERVLFSLVLILLGTVLLSIILEGKFYMNKCIEIDTIEII